MTEKISAQVRQVLDVLSKERCHLTAEEILGRLDGVSTATVYRALESLTDKGLVRRIQTGKRSSVYEYSREPHMHFVCTECGKIYDIQTDFSALVRETAGVCGHQVIWSETTAYGKCQLCLGKKTEIQ